MNLARQNLYPKSDPMNILENLNDTQREAVTHTEGPLLILAGAGSGKTRVITHRIGYLIEKGVKPYNIFAVTFTNKAAEEMKKRVMNIVGPSGNSVFIKTFHSAAVYILRRFGEKSDIPRNFVIYDTHDQEDLIKKILVDMRLDPKKVKPSMITSRISEIKEKESFLEGADVSLMLPDYFSFDFKEIFTKYQAKMAENNALDFNDLLVKTVSLLRNSPHVLSELQRMWHYFMIDEYQDTNYSQYLIARYLSSASRNICVVGDDDQSIYSWRGADIRNILNFEKDYDNARAITLEENYRSTRQILDAASVIIRNNEKRKEKNVKASRGDGESVVWCSANNEYGEGEFVINTIQSLKLKEGKKNRDFAIFYRTNAQSRVFEDFLRRENIPYRIIGGLKFYDRKEVKDILAYLRFLTNRNDSVSLFRIINVPARGIGKATQDRVSEVASSSGISEWRVIGESLVPGKTSKGLEDFRNIINSLSADMEKVPSELTLSKFMKLVIEKTGYRDNLLEENTLDSKSRLDNLDELLNSIYEYEQQFPDATPEQFIQDISLFTSDENPVSDDQDGSNCVTLMTVHNAKGLEFPVVFLTGLEEDTFPHKLCIDTDDAVEEERRLCYVGITRAMDRIFLTSAEIRRSYTGPEYKRPSRFIDEIPPSLLESKNYSSQFYGSGDSGTRSSIWRDRVSSSFSTATVAAEMEVHAEEKPVPDIPEKDSSSGSRFSVRERVMHPKFGPGRIVRIEGSGDNIKLTISFGLSNKVFLEKYTPIEKIN